MKESLHVNKSKYYEFHKFYVHETGECIQVKDSIEYIIIKAHGRYTKKDKNMHKDFPLRASRKSESLQRKRSFVNVNHRQERQLKLWKEQAEGLKTAKGLEVYLTKSSH